VVIAFFGSAGRAATPAPSRPRKTIVLRDIEVQPMSGSQWRVCDRRWPEHDARSLLGFIERKHNLFEAVQIDHGLERFSFLSLMEATAHFSATTQPK